MKALCVGVNKYKHFPDSSLYGCVNDAQDMAGLFRAHGVEDILVLTNEQATLKRVHTEIKDAVASGRGLLLSLSGHGTTIPDVSGDEPDALDEAFVMHDTTARFANLLTDDMLYDLFAPATARVELWLDTCHSGTGHRLMMCQPGRRRYLHNPATDGMRRKAVPMTERMVEGGDVVLWSGCQSFESSWDAEIGSRYNGAFTRSWLNNYALYGRSCRSYIARKVQATLDRQGYDQHPQLECSFYRRYSGIKY